MNKYVNSNRTVWCAFDSPAFSNMFATRLVLVVFAVLVALAAAQDRCATATIGQHSSNSQSPPEQNLLPGQADWDILIKSTCQTIGVDMTVCDTDVAPTVQLQPSMDEAWVHRNGQTLGVATVDTTIYCADNWRPARRQRPRFGSY